MKWHELTAKRILFDRLAGLRRGELCVQDSDGVEHFGEPGGRGVCIQVGDPRFYRAALFGGTLGVAATYLEGKWDCDDLTELFRLFLRNRTTSERLGGMAKIAALGQRAWHTLRQNTRFGSRRNIQAHYDLGNDFFRVWLDDTLAYSSGIFPSWSTSLREASVEKFDRVCRKLELRPSDHLLEIGTGWGGLAIHAARNYGCHVTTTTISHEQFQLARQRIREAGLDGRITLLKRDYRDLEGQYDKLVSIEMIEAVGRKYFDSYFAKCGELLRPEGSFVIQGIVMPERGYDDYLRSVDFIQRFVFPGGCLPSMGAILESVGRSSELRFVHAEEFAAHYAETLRRWRSAFRERINDVRRLGYAERFIRLWEYYLCYCEAAFEERHIGVMQLLFDGPACRRDGLRIGELAVQRECKVADAATALNRLFAET
jgi:cyclopropane-fatty-acyl-phospholipid synthase